MSLNEKMTLLANAIREKSGLTEKLSLAQMTIAVSNLQLGQGNEDVSYGVIDENGQFQELDLTGTNPENKGTSVDCNLQIFNTGMEQPKYVGKNGTTSQQLDLVKVVAYTPENTLILQEKQIHLTGFIEPGDYRSETLDDGTEISCPYGYSNFNGTYRVSQENSSIYRKVGNRNITLQRVSVPDLHGYHVGWALCDTRSIPHNQGMEFGWLMWFLPQGASSETPIRNYPQGEQVWIMNYHDPIEVTATATHEEEIKSHVPTNFDAERVTGFKDGKWLTSGEKIDVSFAVNLFEPKFQGDVFAINDINDITRQVSNSMRWVRSVHYIGEFSIFELSGLGWIGDEEDPDNYADYSAYNGLYDTIGSKSEPYESKIGYDHFDMIFRNVNNNYLAWFSDVNRDKGTGAVYDATLNFGPDIVTPVLSIGFSSYEIEELDYVPMATINSGIHTVFVNSSGWESRVVIRASVLDEGNESVSLGFTSLDVRAKFFDTGWWVLAEESYTNDASSYTETPQKNAIYASLGKYLVGSPIGMYFPNLFPSVGSGIFSMYFDGEYALHERNVSAKPYRKIIPSDKRWRGTNFGWDFSDGYKLVVPQVAVNEFNIGTADFTWHVLFYPTKEDDQCIFSYADNAGLKVQFHHGRLSAYAQTLKTNFYPALSDKLQLNKWHSALIIRKGNHFYSLVDLDINTLGPHQIISDIYRKDDKLIANVVIDGGGAPAPMAVCGYCYDINADGVICNEDTEEVWIGHDFSSNDSWNGKIGAIDFSPGQAITPIPENRINLENR